jgi:hypothetical protein
MLLMWMLLLSINNIISIHIYSDTHTHTHTHTHSLTHSLTLTLFSFTLTLPLCKWKELIVLTGYNMWQGVYRFKYNWKTKKIIHYKRFLFSEMLGIHKGPFKGSSRYYTHKLTHTHAHTLNICSLLCFKFWELKW